MKKDGNFCRLFFLFVLASPMNVVRVMPVEGAKFYGTRTARTERPQLRLMFHHCLPPE